MGIDVQRGYDILPDNNVIFGIRIANNTDSVISDIQVVLDHNESLFKLKGESIQKTDIIPPGAKRTSKFILKPLGCIHKENIEAILSYRNHRWDKHIITVRPKEVHCICPFLHPVKITNSEFAELLGSWSSVETGMNFEGIGADQITSALMHMYANRFHIVDEKKTQKSNVLYFSGKSTDKEACYLLSAHIRDDHGLTRIRFKAASDRTDEIHGFLNEVVSEVRKLISTINSAKEIGTTKKEDVTSIIEPLAQRAGSSVDSSERSDNHQDHAVRKTVAESGRPGSFYNTENTSDPEEENDIAKMYDSYLKEVKSKTTGIERKQALPLTKGSRKGDPGEKKLKKFRGMTSPSRKKEKITYPGRNKKKLLRSALIAVVIATLALAYLLSNPIIKESIGITGSTESAVNSTTIGFLNAVNDSNFQIALGMCQGKDFLAVASVEMMFNNRGIEAGSIKHIEITSTDIEDDIAAIDTECTVYILDSYGKEEEMEVMPIYFQLHDLEKSWKITQISFTEPFEIGLEDG